MGIRKPTYGETLIGKLLNGLPKDQYYFAVEPRIFDHHGRDYKPDFVVICRHLGLLVIEVKDWVDLRSGTQNEIEIQRRDGTTAIEPHPVDVAEQYAYQVVQQCMQRQELTERYRNRTRLSFPWQVMVALPNIPRDRIKDFERVGIWQSRVVLGKEALTSPTKLETAIRNLPWRWELEEPLTDTIFNLVRGVINPRLVITDATAHDIGTLTPEQEALIEEPLGDDLSSEAQQVVQDSHVRLVRGAAGSGKTLVLANRAEFLARNYPDQRILALTFNRDLADILQERLGTSGVEVKTYNEVCYQILNPIGKWSAPIEVTRWLEEECANEIQATGLSVDYVRQEIRWRKEMNIYDDASYLSVQRKGRGQALGRDKRMMINIIFNKYAAYQYGLKRQNMSYRDWDDLHALARVEFVNGRSPMSAAYDVILIDEAQDFAPSWFAVIQRLLKPGASLFICDDPTQSLYQAFSWLEKGIDVRGRSRILRVPFRCTRSIHRAAYSLIMQDPLLSDSDEIIHPDLDSDELIDGIEPDLLSFENLEYEIEWVEQRVGELVGEGEHPRSIAVLCHSKRSLRNWENLQKQHKGIFIAHFERMKGLDFNHVFLPHLNNTFKGITDENAIAEMRRRLYVGMTRARDTLTLTHHERLPEALNPVLPYVLQL